jgi:hypothetical protein
MGRLLREWRNAPPPSLGSIALTAIVVAEAAILVVLSVATHHIFIAMVVSIAFLISLQGLRRAVRRYRSGRGRS